MSRNIIHVIYTQTLTTSTVRCILNKEIAPSLHKHHMLQLQWTSILCWVWLQYTKNMFYSPVMHTLIILLAQWYSLHMTLSTLVSRSQTFTPVHHVGEGLVNCTIFRVVAHAGHLQSAFTHYIFFFVCGYIQLGARCGQTNIMFMSYLHKMIGIFWQYNSKHCSLQSRSCLCGVPV